MNAIENRYAKEFTACQSILRLADALYERNQGKAVLNLGRYATMAVLSLYAKARKQAHALYSLAFLGYGEDALILSRSLVNLCIDLEYIAANADEAEARARRWTANGRIERRKFAKRVGTTPPDENKINWAVEKALADEWPSSIELRAKGAKAENFYNLPYRHGCSFDHSDSWSASSFLELVPDEVIDMLTGPSERYVDLALLVLSCAFAEVACRFGRFYGFDFAGADREMERLVQTGFPGEGVVL